MSGKLKINDSFKAELTRILSVQSGIEQPIKEKVSPPVAPPLSPPVAPPLSPPVAPPLSFQPVVPPPTIHPSILSSFSNINYIPPDENHPINKLLNFIVDEYINKKSTITTPIMTQTNIQQSIIPTQLHTDNRTQQHKKLHCMSHSHGFRMKK